jgi:exfoliative toxin A/B
MIFFTDSVKKDLENPIMASVAGTFPMALMLLSVYIRPWAGQAAFIVWIVAILLHIALIVYFTVKFICRLQMPKVYASYFIVYVGIVVASITAPAYEKTGIGTAAFWFGFLTLIALLVLVTIRYVKYPEIPDPAKPLICIYAAPASLCVAGYIQSVAVKSYGFLIAMYVLASVLYIVSLIKAVTYLKVPFYPSIAAFTFPFVISAIASKQLMACLIKMGRPIPALKYIVPVETVIAVVLVIYTIVRYLRFLFQKES